MSTTAVPTSTPILRSTGRTVGRWMVSFAGFPLGGLAAMILIGPVDDIASALGGGLVTGLVLGAVQAWALRSGRRLGLFWTLATAVGLAIGLTMGAYVVDFATGLADLALQGVVSGAVVGAAQAAVLLAAGRVERWTGVPGSRIGYVAAAWPIYLAVVWAVGWTVTTSIGVRVDDQFTVFGSAGALTVTALTSILPLLLRYGRNMAGRPL